MGQRMTPNRREDTISISLSRRKPQVIVWREGCIDATPHLPISADSQQCQVQTDGRRHKNGIRRDAGEQRHFTPVPTTSSPA
jgi:hypothetical protein